MLDTVLEMSRLLSRPTAGATPLESLFAGLSPAVRFESRPMIGIGGLRTDFVRITIAGATGRLSGGPSPTLGVIGRLGGVGARPARLGLVSDADGATAALSVALEVARMARDGDRFAGDVVVSTHVCPEARIVDHDPVPFMESPITMADKNGWDVRPEMDAILSIDTTKGNRILNHRGIAITPTVKEGYILKVSPDLLDVYEAVSGTLPQVLAITTQDILPYGTGIDHLNSLMQPATATSAPVVGIAITAQTAVAGSQSFASHETDIDIAVRFSLETAFRFGQGKLAFYDPEAYAHIIRMYGSLAHLMRIPGPIGQTSDTR